MRALSDLGFDGFSLMECDRITRKLAYFLLDSLDVDSKEIQLGDKKKD